MTLVVVPVRYPLTAHSAATLREGVRVADERDADLRVLHVDLFQQGGGVSRQDLKRAVERRIGRLDRARYAVRRGFLVEETILEEAVAEDAGRGRHRVETGRALAPDGPDAPVRSRYRRVPATNSIVP